MPPHRITTAAAAALLTQVDTAQFLKPFMRSEQTVAAAARELGVPFKRLHHAVGRFVAAGLLTVTGQRARRGRPMTTYRAVSDTFEVDVAALSLTDRERTFGDGYWNRRVLDRMARAAHDVQVIHVHLNDQGSLVIQHGPESPPAAPGALWQLRTATLRLTPQEVRDLQRDLEAVIATYSSREEGQRVGLRVDLLDLN
ncbi:hypothetical protein [Deinococcus radiotolerans]|uniref:Uncharacterized protein n=1 Tax=Deinococcus radiotolerans TaxID=1309407 RepID=A0ABQ2FFD6_9DEIO|nr:hypothetical protein [Deinococcus radiotolerans]GGK92503.1 hypothetical protein GCM10010844_08760 [Deinococcus radiotolerans]